MARCRYPFLGPLLSEKRLPLFCFLALIFLLGLSSASWAASWPLIIQLPSTISAPTIAGQLQGTVIDAIPGANIYLLNVPMLPAPASAAQMGIQWMELNQSVTLPRFALGSIFSAPPSAAPDWYKLQPAMQLINATKALPFSAGKGVVVADINSKLDYSHPALSGHLTGGYDFIASRPVGFASLDQSDAGFLDQSDAGFLDQSDAGFLDQSDAGFLDQSNPAYLNGLSPAYSHGSLSAGLIAAIAPGSMIMPLHAFDDDGHSDFFSLAKAIRYAVNNGAQIINLNFGIKYGSFSLAIQNAVQFAQASNVLLVAPAGNDSTSQPQYPAAYSGVMAIAATSNSDVLGLFSNYGSDVFVDAPGVAVISVYPGGYYSLTSGTTLSAAVVAGTAALVRSRITGVPESIARTAVNIDSLNPHYQNQLGRGRIDVLGAVLSWHEPTTISVTAPAVTYNAAGIVTLTVTSTDSSAGIPTGNVSLAVDGGTAVSTALSNGSATFTINGLNAGDHTLTAGYAAQNTFAGSSATGTLHVNPAPTMTTMTSAPNASIHGQTVFFAATVKNTGPGGAMPQGTVTFYDGLAAIGNGTLDPAGVARYGTSGLSTGAHSITAAYGATNNFSASSSPAMIQTAKKADTSVRLESSLNPSSVGAAVTFTATLKAILPGGGTPTGTIAFSDCTIDPDQDRRDQLQCEGNVVVQKVPLNGSGQATLVTSSLAVGMHSLTAAYDGDANFVSSTSSRVSQIIYAYPATRGTFVIGNVGVAIGNPVTFWALHWAESNPLTSGSAPSKFKGFADSISPTPPSPGRVWTAGSGNGSKPPTSVPQYMAVIVSSSITQSGTKISGNISRMVVVRTAQGYEPRPGHAGTGTVVAFIAP